MAPEKEGGGTAVTADFSRDTHSLRHPFRPERRGAIRTGSTQRPQKRFGIIPVLINPPDVRAEPERLWAASRSFLDWWLDSERWIAARLGPSYRAACHRHFKRLPKSRPWLPPARAMEWVGRFRDDPFPTPRAKRFGGGA